MKKTVTLITAVCCCQLVLILLQACCGDVLKTCYSIRSFSLQALDNTDSTAATPENNTILAKALLLRLTVDNERKICSRADYRFINSAYAFKKDCEVETYQDDVDSLSIISDADFDAAHKAGSALNAYFKMPRPELLYRYEGAGSVDIYLLTPPKDEGIHKFTLRLHLADGRMLETQTNPVKLIK